MSGSGLLVMGAKAQAVSLPDLTVSGHVFLAGGLPFTVIGMSQFSVAARVARGEDVTPLFRESQDLGINYWRVWTATKGLDQYGIVGVDPSDHPDYYSRVIPYVVDTAAAHGIRIELTGYTGWNDPWHWEQLYEAATRCRTKPLGELVNELDQNTNEPDACGRIFWLSDYPQWPAPFLTSRGSNGAGALPVRGLSSAAWETGHWSYEVTHFNGLPARSGPHNSMEFEQGDPKWPEMVPSHKPIILDENTRPDSGLTQDHADDVAACSALLIAGSVLHCREGKASLPLQDSLPWVQRHVKGANRIDLRYQRGDYRHAAELEPVEWGGQGRCYQRRLPDGTAGTACVRP